ncbi:hypothetical protein, partial [Shewanella chilikensis]|uniref:hypothetical protein n=1 Tax=Shewanella TaxID=22 RepID=UPI00399A80E7
PAPWQRAAGQLVIATQYLARARVPRSCRINGQHLGTTNQPHGNAAGQLVISSSIPRVGAGARPYRINGQRPSTTTQPHGNAPPGSW